MSVNTYISTPPEAWPGEVAGPVSAGSMSSAPVPVGPIPVFLITYGNGCGEPEPSLGCIKGFWNPFPISIRLDDSNRDAQCTADPVSREAT